MVGASEEKNYRPSLQNASIDKINKKKNSHVSSYKGPRLYICGSHRVPSIIPKKIRRRAPPPPGAGPTRDQHVSVEGKKIIYFFKQLYNPLPTETTKFKAPPQKEIK